MPLTFGAPTGNVVAARPDDEAIIEELRQRPGEWALVCEAKNSDPECRLRWLELRIFAPLLEYERRQGQGQNVRLYARWPPAPS